MSSVLLGAAALIALGQLPDLSDLTRQLGEAERSYALAAARTLVESQREFIDVSTPIPHRQVFAASLLLRAELAGYAQARTENPAAKEALTQESMEAAAQCLPQLALLPETAEKHRMRADCFAQLAELRPLSPEEKTQWHDAVQAAEALGPANPRVHVSAAKYCLAANEPGAALQHAQRALDLNPVLESALMVRAMALESIGRQEEAVVAWRQVQAQNPSAPESKLHLPDAFLKGQTPRPAPVEAPPPD